MSTTFGDDPVRQELTDVLRRMDEGHVVDRNAEYKRLDLKEEAGRRDRSGQIGPGSRRNESAAQKLAAEASCMANTPGGGALIVGVADDGTLIGADLDAEWLRHRIFELSRRLLTVDVSEAMVRGVRLLVVIAPSAVEPIRINDKIFWRVDDHCVEVDAATWHARRMRTLNYDWSGDASTTPVSAVRTQAVEVARDFLLATGDSSARELANNADMQLLRRLHVMTVDGLLTNAGVLAFVGRVAPSLDYVHREHAGGDSTIRVNRPNRSLLEELSEVFLSIDAHNATRHLPTGLVIRQVRDIPALAAREAVVNGLAHREWGLAGATTVEQVGRTLRVTSPGGFFGGVNESNIITHPSQSRNSALTQLLADLGIAEREGIGVDRMVREMVRVGHQPPVIREISGPYVRTSLVGDTLDEAWIGWLASLQPNEESADVSSLLLLRHLVDTGWMDERRAAPLIQLTVEEARGAIAKLARATIAGRSILAQVDGTPDGTDPAWRMSTPALNALAVRDQQIGQVRRSPSRAEIAQSYAAARGRVSTTELGSIVGASATNVGGTLKALATAGVLRPSSAAGRGRGFFYRWAGDNL